MHILRAPAGAVCAFAIAVSALFVAAPPDAHAARWRDVDSNCYDGGVDGWSWYRYCWGKKKRINDNTPLKDVFAFRGAISGYATDGKHLAKLWIEPEPRDTSPAMNWDGSSPFKPDSATASTSNCVTWGWEIGVAAGVYAAFSQSGQVCDEEKYYPKFFDDPGHHAGIWQIYGNCLDGGSGNTRKAATGIVVRVKQNKVPLWDSSKRGAHAYSSSGSC